MCKDDANPDLLEQTFPDPVNAFLRNNAEIDINNQKTIFVIDTNCLLVPYSLGKDSLADIKSVYQNLVANERLFIPFRVASEFVKHRSEKVKEIHLSLYQHLSNLPSFGELGYPLLEDIPEFQKLKNKQNDIKHLVKEYKELLNSLLQLVESWDFNDPVSQAYAEIFRESCFINHKVEPAVLSDDLKKRNKCNIPPGFQDKSKKDGGIGDLHIWYTIMEYGATKSVNVIFVSNDEKNDWMVKSNNKSISTRYELIDEFSRKTNGYSFRCMTFADFLSKLGSKKETVEAVDIEAKRSYEMPPFLFDEKSISDKQVIGVIKNITSMVDFLNEFISMNPDDTETFECVSQEELQKVLDSFKATSNILFSTKYWYPLFPHIHKISDYLEEISSANYRIGYEQIRMKHSTEVEEAVIKPLCEKVIKEATAMLEYFKVENR